MKHPERFTIPALYNQSFAELSELGVIDASRSKVFSEGTRDSCNITVFKDANSGVIYIREPITHDEAYRLGGYRKDIQGNDERFSHQRQLDLRRRQEYFQSDYIEKRIVDFGCGHGDFLKSIKHLTTEAVGIELQDSLRNAMNDNGITCYSTLDSLVPCQYDTVFMFHVLEHLDGPIRWLKYISNLLRPGGRIVIEVPSANDFLFSCSDSFRNHTLWSQHLVLHTRDSLRSCAEAAGLRVLGITGIQRYGLANHLSWLINSMPTGNCSELDILETPGLTSEWALALSRIDKNDTYLMTATKD
jgi:SAM-dependent methyltransferase